MSAQITVHLAGSERAVPQQSTAGDLFAGDRAVLVARVNGQLRDLAHVLVDGDNVEPVTAQEPDGLEVLRHSTAHVLAQAVQELDPQAKLGIGPPIRDGFYYDFDVEVPFNPEDLKALDKVMQRIINEGQTFVRREVSDAEALDELAGEPYKCELIGIKGGAADDVEGAAGEVGGAQLTIYDNVRKDGTRAWGDLCRGPHVPSTKVIGNAYKLMRSAAGRKPRLRWPNGATTVGSVSSSTSIPSPTSWALGCRSSIPRVGCSNGSWRTTPASGTCRRASRMSAPRTSRGRVCSTPRGPCRTTRTRCSPPWMRMANATSSRR